MKVTGPNAVLRARRDWNDGLASFSVELDSGPCPDFLPGQFTTLALPEDSSWDGDVIRRAYSIASSPRANAFEFYVRLVDEGALTPRLFALEVGDAVFADERISGNFTLERAQDAEHLLLIGTGTGVAPYRPMLEDPETFERFGRVVLLYGARWPADLAYLEEFRELERQQERFVLCTTVSGPRDELDPSWGSAPRERFGRVQVLLEEEPVKNALGGGPVAPERTQVYLCGNPAMIEDLQTRLEGIGLRRHRKKTPGHIHTEKYW